MLVQIGLGSCIVYSNPIGVFEELSSSLAVKAIETSTVLSMYVITVGVARNTTNTNNNTLATFFILAKIILKLS